MLLFSSCLKLQNMTYSFCDEHYVFLNYNFSFMWWYEQKIIVVLTIVFFYAANQYQDFCTLYKSQLR